MARIDKQKVQKMTFEEANEQYPKGLPAVLRGVKEYQPLDIKVDLQGQLHQKEIAVKIVTNLAASGFNDDQIKGTEKSIPQLMHAHFKERSVFGKITKATSKGTIEAADIEAFANKIALREKAMEIVSGMSSQGTSIGGEHGTTRRNSRIGTISRTEL